MAADALRARAWRLKAWRLHLGPRPFDDTLKAGEIVGLAGLDGQGQEAFLEALCGLRPPAAGRVSVDAGRRAGSHHRASARRSRRGVAYLARDRRANGIFPSLSILDNFGVVSLGRDLRLGFIDRRRQRARYETYRQRLSIVAPSPDQADHHAVGRQPAEGAARSLARARATRAAAQ